MPPPAAPPLELPCPPDSRCFPSYRSFWDAVSGSPRPPPGLPFHVHIGPPGNTEVASGVFKQHGARWKAK